VGDLVMVDVVLALEDGRTFQEPAALLRMRDALANSLRDAFPGVMFNTPLDHALPTTLNFSVPGRSSKELMDVLDAGGIRVSAGSACSAAKAAPSHVLLAMGLPEERAASAIRMSFGPACDEAWIARACARIRHCGEALAQAQRHPTQAAAADGALLACSIEGIGPNSRARRTAGSFMTGGSLSKIQPLPSRKWGRGGCLCVFRGTWCLRSKLPGRYARRRTPATIGSRSFTPTRDSLPRPPQSRSQWCKTWITPASDAGG
jgi:hypothetical protein